MHRSLAAEAHVVPLVAVPGLAIAARLSRLRVGTPDGAQALRAERAVPTKRQSIRPSGESLAVRQCVHDEGHGVQAV
jgi:hypothetical protein